MRKASNPYTLDVRSREFLGYVVDEFDNRDPQYGPWYVHRTRTSKNVAQQKALQALLAEIWTMNDFFKQRFVPDGEVINRIAAIEYRAKFKRRAKAELKRELKAVKRSRNAVQH